MPSANSVSIASVLADLEKSGGISPRSKSILAGQNREIAIPQIKVGFEDPVYAAILIDNSPSMKPYQDAVIASQNQLLEVLRGSALCRKNALLVAEYLFSETIRQLKEFTPLNPAGNDEVPKLSTSNYTFEPWTALYQAVYQVLQDIAVYVEFTRKQFVSATFTISVITDGADNKSVIGPSEIKLLIQEMRQKGYLRKSVVVGLTGTDLSAEKVNEIRNVMGFDEAIAVDRNPAEIRRAFDMVSKSIARG
jgi:hypothetical protein